MGYDLVTHILRVPNEISDKVVQDAVTHLEKVKSSKLMLRPLVEAGLIEQKCEIPDDPKQFVEEVVRIVTDDNASSLLIPEISCYVTLVHGDDYHSGWEDYDTVTQAFELGVMGILGVS